MFYTWIIGIFLTVPLIYTFGSNLSWGGTLSSRPEKGSSRTSLAMGEALQSLSDSLRVESGPSGPKPRHQILIVTAARSGSTLLGNILNRYPGTFYHYEPLNFVYNNIKDLRESRNASAFLKDRLQCALPSANYMGHIQSWRKTSLLYNTRFWKACRGIWPHEAACFLPQLNSQVCNALPVTLIKSIRYPLKSAQDLLADPELGQLKIVFLVRDPRWVLRSRMRKWWCTQNTCRNITWICQRLNEDVEAYMRLKVVYPGKLLMIQYEDLVEHLWKKTKDLFQFLGLNLTPAIGRYVDHKVTKRPSHNESLNFNPVDSKLLKDSCSKPMHTLAYKFRLETPKYEPFLPAFQ